MNNANDIKEEIARLAPPASVSALSMFGVALSEWVYILTIIYLIVQIFWLVYKVYRHCRPKGE